MDFIPRGITNLSSTEATVLCVGMITLCIFFTTIVFKVLEDASILIKLKRRND